jgi:hypothetical protein
MARPQDTLINLPASSVTPPASDLGQQGDLVARPRALGVGGAGPGGRTLDQGGKTVKALLATTRATRDRH